MVDKGYASAFFGTPLLSFLIKLKADTLIVTGGTTSGCVRAFCVDAVSRSFNVGVVADAVFDRISASHTTALLDLWMKYCDLLTSDETVCYLKKQRQPAPEPRLPHPIRDMKTDAPDNTALGPLCMGTVFYTIPHLATALVFFHFNFMLKAYLSAR